MLGFEGLVAKCAAPQSANLWISCANFWNWRPQTHSQWRLGFVKIFGLNVLLINETGTFWRCGSQILSCTMNLIVYLNRQSWTMSMQMWLSPLLSNKCSLGTRWCQVKMMQCSLLRFFNPSMCWTSHGTHHLIFWNSCYTISSSLGSLVSVCWEASGHWIAAWKERSHTLSWYSNTADLVVTLRLHVAIHEPFLPAFFLQVQLGGALGFSSTTWFLNQHFENIQIQ